MPYSKQTFAYAGGARTFTIALTLGYIKEADIEVYVVGELTGGGDQIFRTFTFDSEFVVNVTDSIVNPSSVVVQRTVSKSVFEADFEAGVDITNRNVMLDFRQNFMLMHEILDGRIDGIDVDVRATAANTSAIAALASEVAAAASAASINAAEIILRDGSIAMTAFLDLDGVTPTQDQHAASKKYVDDSVGGGGVMLLDGSQQMTGELKLKAVSPTLDDHATRKKYVVDLLALKAALASPALTGNPTAPTQAVDNNSTRLATTAFVLANAGGGAVDVQTFAASGTWTKPGGARFVYLEMIGGGGSGGKSGSGDGGGGGGGGALSVGWLNASDLGATEAVVVGAGAAGVSSNGDGVDGGDSLFGDPSLLTGWGGRHGKMNTGQGGYGGLRHAGYNALGQRYYAGDGGTGVLGGSGNVGSKTLYGGAGGGGGGDTGSGGSGGVSIFGGNGGDGTTGAAAPTAGAVPGGGGGGIESATTSGAGGDGQVTVWTI